MSKEYEPIICEKCKEPKSRLREDGVEAFMKCQCNYIHGVLDAALEGIHADCLGKTMSDWSPPIFKVENAGAFRALITTQMAQAVATIHEFAFRDVGGRKIGIHKSIRDRKTLFVRGPHGSGKGLLMASVKFAALTRKLSVTSAKAQSFDDFKYAIINSKFHSLPGYECKAFVAEEYETVDLMTIEGLRADSSRTFSATNDLDALIARRCLRDGAMMLTSEQSCGQIGGSLGERLRDSLSKESCDLIMMFDPREAECLHRSLLEHRDSTLKSIFDQAMLGGEARKATATAKMAEREERLLLDKVFFFEDAFPLPRTDADPFKLLRLGQAPHVVQSQWNKFSQAKAAKGLDYEEGIRKAQMDAVRACKVLADKMTDKEIAHVGKLVSCATSGEARKELISKARLLRDEMGRLGNK